MPLYLPKDLPDARSQYISFIGPEKSNRILDFFTFSWNGKTKKILESLKKEESRDFTSALLLANPRWLKSNLGFGMELYKSIRKDKSEKGKALKTLLQTAYKLDRVLVWDSSKRKVTTRRYLKATGADLSSFYFQAINNGNERQIRLLKPLFNVNSSLILAIQKNEVRVVKSLLKDAGIDITLSNETGGTPLSFAMEIAKIKRGKDLRILKLLIKKKGSEIPNGELLNQPLNATGHSPLHLSMEDNDVDFAKALLQIPGIDPNIRTARNNSALNVAIIKGCPEIVELLLAHPETDINLKGNEGNTAIAFAIAKEDFAIANRLMQMEEIDLTLKNDKNATLLLQAVVQYYQTWNGAKRLREGYFDLILKLLEKDQIDLFALANTGSSVFQIAQFAGPELFDLLLDYLPGDTRLNREGLATLSGGSVPEPPEKVRDQELSHLYKKYCNNPWGINRMISAAARRDRSIAALPTTNESRELYYDQLEKILKNIVHYLDQLPEAEREAPLQMLNDAGPHCAVRWMQEAILVFSMLSGDEDQLKPASKIQAFVKNLLLQSYQDMIKEMSGKLSVHAQQAWLALIGKELHLPGAELGEEALGDPFATEMRITKDQALTLFLRGYFTSTKVLEKMKKHVTDPSALPKLAEPFGAFWKEKIPLEWAQSMTKTSFQALVAEYAETLKEKPNEISIIVAYRLKNILPPEELKSSNFDWLRKIHTRKKMKSITETTRSQVSNRLDIDLNNSRLDRTMDEDLIFFKEEIFEETLYAVGIFREDSASGP